MLKEKLLTKSSAIRDTIARVEVNQQCNAQGIISSGLLEKLRATPALKVSSKTSKASLGASLLITVRVKRATAPLQGVQWVGLLPP
jgi:hypothetical protein